MDFENWALVPSDFEVPERHAHERFCLVPLNAALVLADYESWMSNVEHVRRYEIRLPAEPTSTWPTYDLSPLSNLVDMGWHFKEFQRRGSFPTRSSLRLTRGACSDRSTSPFQG